MTSTLNLRFPSQGISGPPSKVGASSKTGAFEKRLTRSTTSFSVILTLVVLTSHLETSRTGCG